MKPETHAELDRIASAICNDLCHWSRVLKDVDALGEKCAACRPLVDMANLAERLEGTSADTHTPLRGQLTIKGW